MKPGEKYWSYKQPPIPELSDLPALPKVFNGNEDQWQSLSPGMRREIYRDAMKRKPVAPGDNGNLWNYAN